MSFKLLRESETKARNNYSCVWCGEDIIKGEKYHSRTYSFEGFHSDKSHLECHSAMKKIDWFHYDGGFNSRQFKRGLTETKSGEEMVTK